MSRDIKFRGKRINDNEWTYGGLVIESNGTAWISKHFHKGEWEQVELATVGQSTGLVEDSVEGCAEAKTIYEDDIVLIVDVGEQGTSRVTFEDGRWSVDYWGEKTELSYFVEEARVFIIGNVHENPELLESE